MVTERGQLILVGALAVAVLILGVTFTLNSTLFIENSQTDESTAAITQAERIDKELAQSVLETTFHTNHRTRNHTWNELKEYVRDNVTVVTGAVRSQSLRSGSRSVNVSITNFEEGTRVVQRADGNFTLSTAGGPDESFNIIESPPGTNSSIEWFVLNLNASANRSGPVVINLTNSNSEFVELTIEQVNESAFIVSYTNRSAVVGGRHPESTDCMTQDGRLVISHKLVSPHDDTCRYGFLDEIHSINFTNGSNANGKYSFVVNRSGSIVHSDIDKCTTTIPRDDPCHTPVVWSLQLETATKGPDLVQRRWTNITVYPDIA